MKVLVTGITGMVGGEFARAYRKDGHDVVGIARNSAPARMYEDKREDVIRCDLLDRDQIEKIVNDVQPDLVIHMAAQAFNGWSWDSEVLTHETNYFGSLNLFRAVRNMPVPAKMLIACTSAEYGDFKPEECPLKEDRNLRPLTPYGVSKVGMEMLAYQYISNYGLKIYLPRMFIHVGTGHPPATAIQNFARQLAMIVKGKMPPEIHVGNLNTSRDFIDVRDGVRGMMMLANSDLVGTPVNICTGNTYKIQDILDWLIEIAGVKVKVVRDERFVRISDEPTLVGDNSRLKSLGWQQKYTIKQTLEAVFDDWMTRV